jgi:dolichol-phosphate mannosyltransferase
MLTGRATSSGERSAALHEGAIRRERSLLRDERSPNVVAELKAARPGGYELTIVVPTFKERENVGPLVARLDTALLGLDWEVVFVDDDSPDETAASARDVAQHDRRIRCIQRIGRRGLSSACIEGALSSAAPYIAVMDADLQHDETALPDLFELVRSGACDVAVGTRYALGGSVGDWDGRRQQMSRFATWLSRKVTGVNLSDPMSGFFVIRREVLYDVVRSLSGLGFKILLDILATPRSKLRVGEVPYEFRPRLAGESKLDSHALWEFLLLLADKRIGKYVPARFLSFSLIGGLGVGVHFVVLSAAFKLLGSNFPLSQAAAAGSAMIFNYSLNNILTYQDRRRTGWRWWTGLASFVAVCALGATANVGVASYLFLNNTGWIVSAAAGILMGAVWNYAVSSVYTWQR